MHVQCTIHFNVITTLLQAVPYSPPYTIRWGIDQSLVSHSLLSHGLCPLPPSSPLWATLRLPPPPSPPSPAPPSSCYQGDEETCDRGRLTVPLGCLWWHFHPDQDIFFVFLVRAACGVQKATNGFRAAEDERHIDYDTGESLFHNADRRELSVIQGSRPPIRYHSMRVEIAKPCQDDMVSARQFREFLFFKGSQVYPEYLIAYQRI